MRFPFRHLIGAILLTCAAHAAAIDTSRQDVREFVDQMVAEHGFDRDALIDVLAGAEVQQSILDAISRPAEKTLNWTEYRAIFMKPERIQAGVDFWRENADEIRRISDETGVSEEMLLGIIGVETYFGRITGNYRVIDALSTLAFSYPPRSRFFRRELGEFLLLAREEGVDVSSALGSYAGAMGAPQFIPSSYRAYADDGDGDGRIDLWNSWDDVLASVASYFVRHRWRPGAPVTSAATLAPGSAPDLPERNTLKADSSVAALRAGGLEFDTEAADDDAARTIVFEGADGRELHVGFHNFYVITRYNRSAMYAMAVWQLGNEIAAARHAAQVAGTP